MRHHLAVLPVLHASRIVRVSQQLLALGLKLEILDVGETKQRFD